MSASADVFLTSMCRFAYVVCASLEFVLSASTYSPRAVALHVPPPPRADADAAAAAMSSAGRAVSVSVEELELELRGLLRGNLWLQVSTLCLHAQDVHAGAVVVEDTVGTLFSDVATVRALLTTEVFDASDDLAVLLPGVSSEENVLEAIVAVAKQVCGVLPRPRVTPAEHSRSHCRAS
jgi:hypothetical protein